MRVDLQQVERRFGRTVALDGIDLSLPTGSRTALLGPNGSGKSTLMRALLGLIRYRGTIAFDGRVRQGEDAAVARHIAYVPQVPPRLSAALGDLVLATCALRAVLPARVAEIASGLGLDLPSLYRRPLRDLSGGMRQKTLAALALAAAPRLLVLDEPTASMDAASRQRFFEMVDALPRSTTVVLCSHRLDELRSLVDQVAVLGEGRLQSCGPAAQFLATHGGSSVEVRVADGGESALAALGFIRRRTGLWTRTVSAPERADLVRAVVERAGQHVLDLLVHDQNQQFEFGGLPPAAGRHAGRALPWSLAEVDRHAS